eukprot:502050-Rhodomonas_salina.1
MPRCYQEALSLPPASPNGCQVPVPAYACPMQYPVLSGRMVLPGVLKTPDLAITDAEIAEISTAGKAKQYRAFWKFLPPA